MGGREKRLNTGEPVLDVPYLLLHQQREMTLMRADQQREMALMREEVRNVTGLLNELKQHLAPSVSAKVRLQLPLWQSGFRNEQIVVRNWG